MYQAGAFFGAMAGYPLGYFLGRRKGLFVSALIFVLGAGMMCGANGARGLGLIYGGRVLAGFGIGGASNLTPLYISEIAPPAIRGQLVGMYEIGWQVGGIVGYWINYVSGNQLFKVLHSANTYTYRAAASTFLRHTSSGSSHSLFNSFPAVYLPYLFRWR